MSGFRGRLGERWLSICSLDHVIGSADLTPKCSSLVNGKPGKPVPKVLHFSNARVRGGAQIQRGLVQVIVP